MAKKSGISVEIITKFGGILKQSIRKLGGKITADLGFGPDYSVSCTTVYYAYLLEYNPPEPGSASMAWIGLEPQAYELDVDNGMLYNAGACGTEFAELGYYSPDFGTTVYAWQEKKGVGYVFYEY
jgi:hypothetical protein